MSRCRLGCCPAGQHKHGMHNHGMHKHGMHKHGMLNVTCQHHAVVSETLQPSTSWPSSPLILMLIVWPRYPPHLACSLATCC